MSQILVYCEEHKASHNPLRQSPFGNNNNCELRPTLRLAHVAPQEHSREVLEHILPKVIWGDRVALTQLRMKVPISFVCVCFIAALLRNKVYI